MKTGTNRLARWRRDPVAFVQEVLINPKDGSRFELYTEQITFLREALTLTKDGRFRAPEMIFGAPKKSGKTGLAAMIAIYVAVVLAGNLGEIYCLANDYEQSASRVFKAVADIIEASPLLRGLATITQNKITFKSSGTFIQACASDYSGFAGGNPTLTIVDELWGFIHEASRRLFDEAIPSPASKLSGRLTVTYAGFSNESDLLEGLYKRGLQSEEIAPDLYSSPGMLMYWTHDLKAPWQHLDNWAERMRASLRPNQYLRLIENRWTSTEDSFIPLSAWDACVDPAAHPSYGGSEKIFCGLDASVRHDSTAIVCVTVDHKIDKLKLVWHRVFQPSPDAPLDFEGTVEATLKDLRRRFNLQQIYFDPYQLVSVAQRLRNAGLNMCEFPQSSANLTEAASNLFQLVMGRAIVLYPDADMRLAASRCVATESSRGNWKISKEKQSHKIDSIVALAMACLAARKGDYIDIDLAARIAAGCPPPDETRREVLARLDRMHGLGRLTCRKCNAQIQNGEGYVTCPTRDGEEYEHNGLCPREPQPIEVDSFGDPTNPGKPGIFDLAGMRLRRSIEPKAEANRR